SVRGGRGSRPTFSKYRIVSMLTPVRSESAPIVKEAGPRVAGSAPIEIYLEAVVGTDVTPSAVRGKAMFEAINHVIQAARRLAPTAAPDIACFGARMLRLGSLYAALVLTAPASAEGVKLFEVPTPNSYPESVAVGPGGAIW